VGFAQISECAPHEWEETVAIADVASLLKIAEDIDLPKALTEVVLSALVGIAAWFFGRWFERRKARRETALKACKTLRTTLAKWYTEIKNAVTEEGAAQEILKRIKKVQTDQEFEPRVATCVNEMTKVKECATIITMIPIFTDKAYETKGNAKMALVHGGSTDIMSQRLVEALLGDYKKLDEELSRVIVLLG
jgi:hypothetical protein